MKKGLKVFIDLTELYTFIGNVFLILIGLAFSIASDHVVNPITLLVYTLAIFLFHVFTNAYNNLKDYQNASDNHDYKERSNTIGRHNLSLKLVQWTCLVSIIGFILSGLYLVVFGHTIFILIGVVGFGIGVFYSAGPLPINATPLAEIITACAMGFLVPLGAYATSLTASWRLDVLELVFFAILCIVPVLCMFNCLLANNTCDLEEDIENGRQTLVYYLGKQNAVLLFKSVVLTIFLMPIILWAPGMVHPIVVGLIIYAPFAIKNLKPYFASQVKRETFPHVIHTMERTLHIYALLYFISVIL